MARKKPQQNPVREFNPQERDRFLYRTAAEMRSINDAADKRLSNDIERDDEATVEQSNDCGRAF